MSEPLRETALKTATVWPVLSKDPYGRVIYDAPYTVNCTIEQGSNRQYRDQQGVLYIPASIYWFEYSDQPLKLNDWIAPGDKTASTDPSNIDTAELIKNVIIQDNSILGDIDDIQVLT